MTSTTMTIYDPEGEPFEMEWSEDITEIVEPEMAGCDFCARDVTGAWWYESGPMTFVVCDDCAKANATTEGR